MYSQHIYISKMRLQNLKSAAGVSGSLSGGEVHFSNRLTKEAASAIGFLAANAIVQHLGLMLAEVYRSFPTSGGANILQSMSLKDSWILDDTLGFLLGPALLLLFLFALVLLTGLGPSLVTVVDRMTHRCDRGVIHVRRPFDVAILSWC